MSEQKSEKQEGREGKSLKVPLGAWKEDSSVHLNAHLKDKDIDERNATVTCPARFEGKEVNLFKALGLRGSACIMVNGTEYHLAARYGGEEVQVAENEDGSLFGVADITGVPLAASRITKITQGV